MSNGNVVNVLRRFNSGLTSATRSLDDVSRLIKELEGALHELEQHKDEVKKDMAAKTELSTCNLDIQSLRSALSRLEMELSDTQSKIQRVQF